MDFALTQDQRLMQESLVRTLEQASSLDRVRRFAGDLKDKGGDIWQALVEFGLAGIVIPEEHGGLGLSMLDAALASEALGAAVAPVPFMGVVLGPIARCAAAPPNSRHSGCRSWRPAR
jgi:alkylation response protein AidB-like acyl-CoA dehydrogenase